MEEKMKSEQVQREEPFYMHKTIKQVLKTDFGERLNFDKVKRLLENLGSEKVSDDFIYRLCLLDLKRGEVESPHFQDSIEIAEMAPELIERHESETEEQFLERQSNLRLAGVVHDCGKAGPPNATRDQQQAFVDAFNLHFYKNLYLKKLSDEEREEKHKAYEEVKFFDLPINQAFEHKVSEMVFNSGIAEKDLRLIMEAINEQPDDAPEQTKITPASKIYQLFGPPHVYWSSQLLKREEFNEKVILYASCHHLMDGRNTLGIDLDELSDIDLESIAAIEISDKYQAIRKRSHIPHDKVMEIYQGSIERKFTPNAQLGYVKNGNVIIKNHERFKKAYLTALARIDQKRETLEKEIGLDETSQMIQKNKDQLKKMHEKRDLELKRVKKEREELLAKQDEQLEAPVEEKEEIAKGMLRMSIKNWNQQDWRKKE